MNLAAARDELAARGFKYLLPGRMNIMLNDAKNQFEDAFDFPWLETVVDDTAPLTIANLKDILVVLDTTNGCALLGNDVRTLAEWDPRGTAAGNPQYWWLDGDTLRVWPTAEVEVEVRYTFFSDELEDATDEPLIPARYHSVWIDLAAIQAYKDSDNYVAANALRTDVTLRLAGIVDTYAARNMQNPEPGVIRWGAEDS